MDNLEFQRLVSAGELYDGWYLQCPEVFLYYFNKLAHRTFISGVDCEKATSAIREAFADQIMEEFNYHTRPAPEKKDKMNETLFVLRNEVVISFSWSACEIVFGHEQVDTKDKIIACLSKFKEKQKREPTEINLVVSGKNGLELKPIEVKRTTMKLDLFYEDDFKATDEVIRKRLRKNNDKGIVLLHGLPGSGKTSYLRHLVCRIRKKVLFLSPSVAGNLMGPDFTELLIKNANSVIIVEDAENILLDRKLNSHCSVSDLLNISDGLVSDFLNVQMICTFNSALTLVDEALTRKGRLIARYEFGKLSVAKSQRLSDHFGFKTVIREPMTIAEIARQEEKDQKPKPIQTIGFRREVDINT